MAKNVSTPPHLRPINQAHLSPEGVKEMHDRTAAMYHHLAFLHSRASRHPDLKQPLLDYQHYQQATSRMGAYYHAYVSRYNKSGQPGAPMDPSAQGAYAIIEKQLEQWGISSLGGTIKKLIKQGLNSDAIMVQLQDSDAYKKRFAANEIRKKEGKAVLSPSDYISAENQYRSLFQQYGMPKGLYDSSSDLTNYIAKDVSPSEIDARLKVAQTVWLKSGDAYTRAYYKAHMGLTDGQIIAGILDPKKSLPTLQQQAEAAQIGGAANRSGLEVSTDRAMGLATKGVTYDQALQGYGQIAANMATDQAIASRFDDGISQNDEEEAVLLNQKKQQDKLTQLRNAESGLFGGRAGATTQSLSSSGGGSF